MNTIKSITSIFILAVVICLGIAATTPSDKPLTEEWFQLVENGNPLEISHWVPEGESSNCPSTPSEQVCRIYATNDGGNPESGDFADIRSTTDDFELEYENVVKYVDMP